MVYRSELGVFGSELGAQEAVPRRVGLRLAAARKRRRCQMGRVRRAPHRHLDGRRSGYKTCGNRGVYWDSAIVVAVPCNFVATPLDRPRALSRGAAHGLALSEAGDVGGSGL